MNVGKPALSRMYPRMRTPPPAPPRPRRCSDGKTTAGAGDAASVHESPGCPSCAPPAAYVGQVRGRLPDPGDSRVPAGARWPRGAAGSIPRSAVGRTCSSGGTRRRRRRGMRITRRHARLGTPTWGWLLTPPPASGAGAGGAPPRAGAGGPRKRSRIQVSPWIPYNLPTFSRMDHKGSLIISPGPAPPRRPPVVI